MISYVAGGKAVVNNSSVTDGAAVIQTALDNFGGVHILINNAGILRDKKYVLLCLVHLRTLHNTTYAASVTCQTKSGIKYTKFT